MTPYITKEEIPVPCGRCLDCKNRRMNNWSFRIEQEVKRSTACDFITLTYDTMNVPITNNHFMSLDKRDLQLFFKRLRKVNLDKIKYYACGEYGGKTNRPHYHMILFNCDIETIMPSWNLGHIHYDAVTEGSIKYVLKYISKTKWKAIHENDDRIPEFSVMSKGLGDNYITPEIINWHKADVNRLYVDSYGKKVSMPRYYREKIYTTAEREIAVQNIVTKAQDNFHKEVKEFGSIERWAHNRRELIKQNWKKLASNHLKRDKI